jgi:hypothetical protein
MEQFLHLVKGKYHKSPAPFAVVLLAQVPLSRQQDRKKKD